MQKPQGLVFGPFRLDRRDERLWCGHEAIPLSPKTFAVLCCLVTQAGQLVTKEALLAAVWLETVVSESVVTVAIRQLRRVLGDQAQTPRFIETVHGRGYRFIAPLSAPVSPSGPGVMGGPPLTPPALFRPPAHFVGRDAALVQLAQWWTAAREGTRQVGVIAGEAGIGKTALVATFVARVAATEDVWVGHGRDLVAQGHAEAGMAQMRQGIAALRHTGAEIERPWLLSALAMAYGHIGQADEGLAVPEEALAIVANTGKQLDASGLYRCKGELLLAQDGASHKGMAAAEACLHQALAIARRQQAKTLELRAAMSLSRLWQGQGKRDAARALLSEIYGWFTEGSDTTVLRAAQALLLELSP